MNRLLLLAAGALLVCSANAQYPAWQHSGSLYILTTPEGANLPAAVSVQDFPLLIRLHQDFFDFRQARTNGEDLRFSAGGKPLPYQIEEWDAAAGRASIWVRMPRINGNEQQELKLHWGNAAAASESSGAAVFNESNGYAGVWHMSEAVRDEAGLPVTDKGTVRAPGVIGEARRFSIGQGIYCGDKITNYPTGSSPHSTELWFRAEQPNATLVAWGNEQAQGKVVMQYRSPPHINLDCYFSDGNVRSQGRLPAAEWVHVVHAYQKGEARVYVNGVLDGTSKNSGAPLAIRSPSRLWIGGWYNHFNFAGEIDEVRISKVTRSTDWIRLQFENQKPMQTLAGMVVQPGGEFAVAPGRIAVAEGKRALATAKAAGARKIYWILKQNGQETVVAVDRLACTIEGRRVKGDQQAILLVKAVHADGVRTAEIPITITEAIPEPAFELKAPVRWDGRQTIEVTPSISNLAALKGKGAGDLEYRWTVAGLGVIKEVVPGKLILKRAQNSGKLDISLALGNGGEATVRSASIQVKEPKADAWVPGAPDREEMPQDNQFYARDDKNEGTLVCRGTLQGASDVVFLQVYAGDKLIHNFSQKVQANREYLCTAKVKPGLVKYRAVFGMQSGGRDIVLHTATNLVCGDVYLISGQSNALATDTAEKAPAETSDWIRTFGTTSGNPQTARRKIWGNAVWKDREEKLQLGYWGMELAKRLVDSQKIPICIINGAVGGTRIDQHQRNPADPEDAATIYGRLLWRVRQARLAHGVRAVLWHQGENDQGADGPTGGFGWETYQQYFMELAAAWKQDYPNLQHYYVFQIWPKACAMGVNGSDNQLREVQRNLPALYSNLDIMSTVGIKPPGGCHYPLTGWAEFARLIQPLIERDIYGKVPAREVTPPNLIRAAYVSGARDEIALEFNQPVRWTNSLTSQFYLDGEKGQVISGQATGRKLMLKLAAASPARRITYLDSKSWSPDNLLYGENGIAALTFCDVSILAP